jgi:hypothetical protein
VPAAAITKKALKRLRQLHALLGSDNAGEQQTAHRKLIEWLQRHGKTWNDLPELLRDPDAARPVSDPRDQTAAEHAAGAVSDQDEDTGRVTPLDVIRRMFERYVGMEPDEYVAAALWAAHTFVFERFLVTPRLAFIAPVENSGKSTALDVLRHLVPRPFKSDSITPAVLYHVSAAERRTLLLDEFDNQGAKTNGVLLQVLNSGHRQGGAVGRFISGRPVNYPTFAPLALAANRIDCMPPALQTRCVVINMTRRNDPDRRRLGPDNSDPDFDVIYGRTFMWLHDVNLNPDPPLPAELKGRYADNWRPLIAIADASSPAWGAEARAAALALRDECRDENLLVTLLRHLHDIFAAGTSDRLLSRHLCEALNAMDDAPWSEWRGLHGNAPPRSITQAQLAVALRPFGIRPRTIWMARAERTFKGYYRNQFEAAWRNYCGIAPEGGEGGEGEEAERPEESRSRNLLRGR